MKKIFISLIFIVVMFSNIYAGTSDAINNAMSGMTEEQKVELLAKAAQLKQASESTPQRVNQWIDVGKNLGIALSSSAKELGIAADTFLQSKTGTLATFLIVWKFFGRDMVHLGSGVIFFIISFPVWVYFFRKMCVVKGVTYSYNSDGKKNGKRVDNFGEGEVDGTRFVLLLVLCGIVGVTCITIFSM